MAMNLSGTTKRLQIDKANATIVAVTAVSSFIVVFSLVASKALLSQQAYQARVISKKEQARDQLIANSKTIKTIQDMYKVFIETSPNAIGGNPQGTGDKDGNNAQIILDALPSSYDYPALTSSLEKILNQNGVSFKSITGTDDEVAQAANVDTDKAIPIPFEITFEGPYSSIQNVIKAFEASIRPFDITNIKLSGSDKDMTADVKAQTYYQPESRLTIKTEVIK